MQRLPYHNPDHAIDMAETAVKLAVMEGMPEKKIELVYATGIGHDWVYHLGFEWGENERKSALVEGLVLPGFGYSQEDVSEVQRGTMATAFPPRERPKDLFEMVIRDADLANLGRNDFWDKTEAIFKELNMAQVMKGLPLITEDVYAGGRLDFLQTKVEYHTAAAKKLFLPGLARNIEKAKEIVREYGKHF